MYDTATIILNKHLMNYSDNRVTSNRNLTINVINRLDNKVNV